MPPSVLSTEQVDQFRKQGVLVVEDAVTPEQLNGLRGTLQAWVEESRTHIEPYGPPTVDERARFDMGEEHSAEKPALRRVNNPAEISDAYRDTMTGSAMLGMVTDLIGPDVKYHHCKLNIKLPGANTEVLYHQDFPYTPHTNDDIVTALLMLEDVDETNGCLLVVPGSHLGPIDTLFNHDGIFTGTVLPEREKELKARQIPITGKAGSVCLMHTRLQHASEPNQSTRPRPIYICVYTAADAVPLARNPMPSTLEGTIVSGRESPVARMVDLSVELPKQPKSASFFTVQGQVSAKRNARQ